MSQGGLRPYAGLLAEGTAAATQYQGHSEDAVHSDESHAGLPGHTGIDMEGKTK